MEQVRNSLLVNEGIPFAQCLTEVFDRISKLSVLDADIPGLSTGFFELDDMIGGMEAGDLIAVKGVQYTGVTSFLAKIALRTAKATKRPVLFFSREETAVQLTRRILSTESLVPIACIEKGKLTDIQLQKLMIATANVTSVDIRFFDNVRDVSGIMKCCTEVDRPCVIIVDKLPDEDTESVSQMHLLKQMAQKMQVPVLCSCWLRDISDYALSGTDKVLRLERRAAYAPFYDKSKTVCKIERNTHGRNGEIELYWDENTLTFFPVDRTTEKDIPAEDSDV